MPALVAGVHLAVGLAVRALQGLGHQSVLLHRRVVRNPAGRVSLWPLFRTAIGHTGRATQRTESQSLSAWEMASFSRRTSGNSFSFHWASADSTTSDAAAPPIRCVCG